MARFPDVADISCGDSVFSHFPAIIVGFGNMCINRSRNVIIDFEFMNGCNANWCLARSNIDLAILRPGVYPTLESVLLDMAKIAKSNLVLLQPTNECIQCIYNAKHLLAVGRIYMYTVFDFDLSMHSIC